MVPPGLVKSSLERFRDLKVSDRDLLGRFRANLSLSGACAYVSTAYELEDPSGGSCEISDVRFSVRLSDLQTLISCYPGGW